MEVYNTLAREFHDTSTPRNHLIQYKRVADQLAHARLAKKMLLASKKKQLEQCQQTKQNMSDSRLSVISTGSVKEIGGARWELESMERNDLKKKIAQIQKQIENVGAKTHEINAQLTLFVNKQQQIQVASKKAQLTMFNSLQELNIATSQQGEEELKHQQMLDQLTLKRNRLANQIKELLEEKQNKRQRIMRLHMNAKTKRKQRMKSLLEIGENMSHLRDIVRNMVGLHHLYQKKQENNTHSRQQSSTQKQINSIVDQLMKQSTKYDLLERLQGLKYSFDTKFAIKLAKFYTELESQFDINERTNEYLNNHLKSLNAKYDKLQTIIQSANMTTQKQTQEQLTQTQFSLNEKEELLQCKCKIIIAFTNKYHFLLTKLVSLRRTVQQIMGCRVTTEDVSRLQRSDNIVKEYGSLVGRNPQDNKVRWDQVTGIESTFHSKIIDTNSILRLFSCPQLYKSDQDDLSNFNTLMEDSFRSANDFIRKMSQQITSYFRNYPCPIKAKDFGSWPMLSSIPESGHLCIESQEYHRRDNFKLLEKLNKIQLKKRGLLTNIPFNVSVENELDCSLTKQEGIPCLNSPKATSSRLLLKYTNLATRREQNILKQKSVRKLFSKLNSLDNRTQSSRVTNLQSMRQSMHSSRLPISTLSISKIRKNTTRPTREYRYTTGIASKQNR